jgi:hypothetical protein
MKCKYIFTVIAILVLNFTQLIDSIYVITDFGALAHQDHRSAHIVNAQAFISAIKKANQTV